MNATTIKLTSKEAVIAAASLSLAVGESRAVVMYKPNDAEDNDYISVEDCNEIIDDGEWGWYEGRYSWELWTYERKGGISAMTHISNMDDYIVARLKSLQDNLLERFNEQQVDEGDDTETDNADDSAFVEWLRQARADDEEAAEYELLRKLVNRPLSATTHTPVTQSAFNELTRDMAGTVATLQRERAIKQELLEALERIVSHQRIAVNSVAGKAMGLKEAIAAIAKATGTESV